MQAAPAVAQGHESPNLPRKRLLLLLAFVLIASWSLGLYFINRAKSAAMQAGEARVQALARAFSEHTVATIKLVDLSLDYLSREWVASPERFVESEARVRARLGDIKVQIAIADRDGWLVYSALGMSGGRVNVGDLEQFKVHFNEKKDRLHVADRPMRGRISGKWTLQFSRPIFRGNAVDGVALIGVDPLYFSRFYESLHLGPSDIVLLTRNSGQVLTRLPIDEKIFSMRLVGAPFATPDAPNSGIFRRQSQIDGTDRLYAYFRIPEYDLIVEAGLDEAEVMRPYEQIRNTLFLALALITFLSILIGIGLLQRLAEREAYEQHLRDANAQLEMRVGHRTEELRRSLDEMESFSYAVAHDLKAPIRAVAGFSSIVLEQAQAEGGQAIDTGLLAKVVASCGRMNAIVDGLLSLAHISRQPMQILDLELSEEATQIVDDLLAQSVNRRVRVAIAPGLKARGDRVLVRIVLQNLLGNAWKFTANTPDAAIDFGYDQAKSAFYVSDNGAGFSMEYANKLFRPFGRLHTEQEYVGNGIGLVTTKRIVTRLGGRIWAEAAEGKGATFWFTLDPMETEDGPQTHPA
jgi:signal transduction histidine kinase